MEINSEYQLSRQAAAPERVVKHIRRMDQKSLELVKALLLTNRYDYPFETMGQRFQFRLNKYPEDSFRDKLESLFLNKDPGLRVKYEKAVDNLMDQLDSSDGRDLARCKKEAPEVFEKVVHSNRDLEAILRFIADCPEEPEVEGDYFIDLDQAFSNFKHYSN